jgi:hypothetical protein
MEDPPMKTTRLTVAAIALLTGISVAAAADMSQSGSKTSSTTTGSGTVQEKMAKPPSMSQAKDVLSLTGKQRNTAWRDISKLASKEKAPSGFIAKIGAVIPSTLTTHPVPVTTANKVPALRPYQYALLSNNRLLIVNPSDNKVAEIITR